MFQQPSGPVARLLHLLHEREIAERVAYLRLLDDVDELAGAQELHRGDADPARLEHREPARHQHRRVGRTQQHAVARLQPAILDQDTGDPFREVLQRPVGPGGIAEMEDRAVAVAGGGGVVEQDGAAIHAGRVGAELRQALVVERRPKLPGWQVLRREPVPMRGRSAGLSHGSLPSFLLHTPFPAAAQSGLRRDAGLEES